MTETPRPWRAAFAAHLLDAYRRLPRRKGKAMSRAEVALRYEALDLLEEMGAPKSVLELFDALLGGVVAQWEATEHERRWIRPAVEHEARAMAEGRPVTDAEIVARFFLPSRRKGARPDRRAALKEVRAARAADFYRAFVLTRYTALGAEPKTPPSPERHRGAAIGRPRPEEKERAMKHALIAAAMLAMTAAAAFAPPAFAQGGPRGPSAARMSHFAERKAAESQYVQDRLATLNKSDACIKAAANDKELAACQKTEAGELRVARTKLMAARAKARPAGTSPPP